MTAPTLLQIWVGNVISMVKLSRQSSWLWGSLCSLAISIAPLNEVRATGYVKEVPTERVTFALEFLENALAEKGVFFPCAYWDSSLLGSP